MSDRLQKLRRALPTGASIFREFYCLRCPSDQVGLSASGTHPQCLKCGSPEIGMRDNTTITAAARRKGVSRQFLSTQLQKYKKRPVQVGPRRLYRVVDIEEIWHKLQASL